MTTDHIEEKLKEEIVSETPDILEDLLRECGFKETAPDSGIYPEEMGQKNEAEEHAAGQDPSKVTDIRRAGRKRLFRIIGGTAAAAFLVAAGFGLYHSGLTRGAQQEQLRYSAEMQKQENAEKTEQILQTAVTKEEKPEAAIVSLDVNPSVEMSVDDTDHVLSWTAVNQDAEEILHGLDLAGSDVKVAAYAVVGAMLTGGYLNEDVNSVLVSVVSSDEKKGRELERSLSESLNSYLENSAISAAVFGQYAGDDETVKQFAAAHHLSYGKAWLIRTLLSEDPKLAEDSLLKLSTQELLLLWERQPKEQETDHRTVYGSVSISRYILPEAALRSALEYAGLTEESITDPTVEIGCEDGVIIYEVEFYFGGLEYEIDVNALTGEVIEAESEPAGPGNRPEEQSSRIPETEFDPDDDEYEDADDAEDSDADDSDDYDDPDDLYDDDRYDDHNAAEEERMDHDDDDRGDDDDDYEEDENDDNDDDQEEDDDDDDD